MGLESLKREYNNILTKGTTFQKYLDFERELISDNSIKFLEFHYQILSERKKENLYKYIRACFHLRKDREKVIVFLVNKYKSDIKDLILKADIISILGRLQATEVVSFAKDNINSESYDLRYSSIITLGWVGGKEDLPILNERLKDEPDDTLRGYVATSMRQIWFNKNATAEEILPYLYKALIREKSEETLSMIIVVIQDLLKKKFGLKEKEGIIEGNVLKSKEKIIINRGK
ncbi:HEAT repeat domain-containing protein [Weeksellaceae bacterium TAE3-ERU29]|nr:HEAT repeat domain-containing protein [Weeksellaceae bacterium TAE3-ERU29]